MESLQSEALTADYQYNREKRLYDDTTTWLAEVLDGSMRTPFEYVFDGRELYSSDGSPLEQIFDASLEAARDLPAELQFEYRRRLIELEEYHDMIAMMQSDQVNTMVVISDFPLELQDADHDVGGYNIRRKQTMLRVLTKNSDRTLSMRSQSLDKSDRGALEALYNHYGIKPEQGELLGQRIYLNLDAEHQELVVDELTGVYDTTLSNLYGGAWNAGRKHSEGSLNTYDFVRSQADLIGLYIQSAEQFGDNQAFLHDIAATMRKRYEAYEPQANVQSFSSIQIDQGRLIDEIVAAGLESHQAGVMFSGCGLTLGKETQAAEQQLSELGFGNKSQKDCEFVSKKCPVCRQSNAKTKVSKGKYYHIGKSCKA